MKIAGTFLMNCLGQGKTPQLAEKLRILAVRSFSSGENERTRLQPCRKRFRSKRALATEISVSPSRSNFKTHSAFFFSILVTLSVSVPAVLLSATAAPPIPQAAKPALSDLQLSLDLAKSKLNWTVDSTLHMVHGTFAIKQGSVLLNPETGKASGEIIVLVTSGETGNTSRDEKMHKDVLQSSKYPDAVFKPSQVEGHLSRSGPSDVKLHGTLSIHGSDHDLIVPVHAELANEQWKGTAKFEVPFIQWGLKDPSNFLLKVKPIVNVELEMSGAIAQAK